MASCKSPLWKIYLRKIMPFVFKRCIGGNYHWFWDRYCYCCVNEHWHGWHGGIWDFWRKKEIIGGYIWEKANVYKGEKESNEGFIGITGESR